ncbi:MAG: RNA polymerase sigma factor [Bryobacteraceae bacterium]
MAPLAQKSDEELLRLLERGNEEAFTTLYGRRQGGVYRFALQMSGSPQVAEEVTQEVFLSLIRGGGKFDESQGSLRSWLFGAARNQVLRHLDGGRRYVAIEETDEEGGPGVPEPAAPAQALEDLTHGELVESVRQAVLSLPPHYREVVVLCDLQELSYEEAARSLECALGTVRSRLNRGRAMLVDKLRAYATSGV